MQVGEKNEGKFKRSLNGCRTIVGQRGSCFDMCVDPAVRDLNAAIAARRQWNIGKYDGFET
jgi:hypothetical protein